MHPSIRLPFLQQIDQAIDAGRNEFIEDVARRNVIHSVHSIAQASQTIRKLVDEGRVAVVGGVYDVTSGKVDFLVSDAVGLSLATTRETLL
ncbi:MAG TPA: hypothetical protein DCF63_15650 [Planctomycetaceae bacterium]|nr:hypothetical protein [Planctomycetaceae bacterium]